MREVVGSSPTVSTKNRRKAKRTNRNIFGSFFLYKSAKAAADFSGGRTGDVRETYGRRTGDVRETYERRTGDVRETFGRRTRDVRETFGRRSGDIRETFGRRSCKENIRGG